MNACKRFWAWAMVGAALAFAAPAMSAEAPHTAAQPATDQEMEIGQETFRELKAKGEIIESSPLYDVLMPVIEPIIRAAQPKYNHPFKVYLVHESQPNAFAAPGGNIYVVDALLYFAKSKEQLAGVLGHEVSHVIHHDSMELLKKQKEILERELGAGVVLGPTRAHLLALALLGRLHSLSYSREAESRADMTGADLCAGAGTNPWGLVWLFQDFKDARTVNVPQLLSDHPNDQNRVDALKQHFRANPSVFGKFNSDPKSASPLKTPDKAPVVFLR